MEQGEKEGNEGKILKVKEKLGLICKNISLRIFPTKENEVIVLILGEGEDPSGQINRVEVKEKGTLVGGRRQNTKLFQNVSKHHHNINSIWKL